MSVNITMKKKLYILLCVAFLTLIFMLGNWGLTESSEARYATIAKEMFVNNDFLNPTLLGIKHLHKPPLTYYITTLGYKIFGVNEFGARFFMQLALLFQILLVFKITLLLYKNEKIAFAASLIYFSFPITIIAVRTLTTDAYLTTFILAALFFWLSYKRQLKPYYLYLFYLFLGCIFETKGPVGFIVPVTFIITYKIVNKEKIDTTVHQFFGFILFLLVSSVWYLVVINKNVGLFDYLLNHQLVNRVLQNNFKREKSIWYYLLVMPLIGMPWLFYLVYYLKRSLKTIIQQKKVDFILLVTFVVLFIILSISTSKLLFYVLPLYSILAIFSANYLSTCNDKAVHNISIVFIGIIIVMTASLVVLSFLNIDYEVQFKSALVIFIVFGITALVINKKILNSNYLKPAYLGIVFIISITMSANHFFKQNEIKINSVKPIAEFIIKNSNSNSAVLVYNDLLPSLSFYLNREITTINRMKEKEVNSCKPELHY